MDNFYIRNQNYFNCFDEIWIYVADPGAWEILRLFRAFLKRKKHTVRFIFDGWAKSNVAASFSEDEKLKLNDIVSIFPEKNRLLIYGAQKRFASNYAIVSLCNSKNIETFFIFDHWKHFLLNFRESKTGELFLPTRIAAIDDYHRNELVKTLKPFISDDYLSRIDIFGQPAVRESVKYILSMKDQEISELKKKYNPQFKKLILLILEPIQNDFGEDRFPGYNE